MQTEADRLPAETVPFVPVHADRQPLLHREDDLELGAVEIAVAPEKRPPGASEDDARSSEVPADILAAEDATTPVFAVRKKLFAIPRRAEMRSAISTASL